MASYTLIWEFRVRPGCEGKFEHFYGPGGVWAELFHQNSAYIETELLKDRSQPRRYLTIDRWRSAGEYQEFRARFSTQYAELDKLCEELTVREVLLGEFSE